MPRFTEYLQYVWLLKITDRLSSSGIQTRDWGGGCRKECGRRASGWSECLGTSPRSCLRPEHQHARFLLPRTALQIPKTTMISSLCLPRQKHPTPFLSVVVTFSKCHSHLLARSSLQTPFPSAALEMSTSHQQKPVQPHTSCLSLSTTWPKCMMGNILGNQANGKGEDILQREISPGWAWLNQVKALDRCLHGSWQEILGLWRSKQLYCKQATERGCLSEHQPQSYPYKALDSANDLQWLGEAGAPDENPALGVPQNTA